MDQVEANSQTLMHIRRVQSLLATVSDNLIRRAIRHDESKLAEPEASVFAENTAKLKGLTYGSDEYRACLDAMFPALKHHYEHNRHHPEHWSGGIKDMSLLDLIEMIVDWKAASERHTDGDIEKSITINKTRFGYSDEIESIFRRTVAELFPKHREPWHCAGCGNGGAIYYFCEMCGAGKDDYMVAKSSMPQTRLESST
jgi:hypothetical protein